MKSKKPKHSDRKGRKRAEKKSVGLGGQDQKYPINASGIPVVQIDGTNITREA